MNHDQREKISGIVDVLLGLPEARRAEVLQTLCPAAEDQAVRDEVEGLLVEDMALEKQLAGLQRAPVAETRYGPVVGVAVDVTHAEPPPIIGRYHLKKRLGGGGMGEVYLAEQRASIKQTVAIKLIKPGFDSREVIARFNAERQALARMDHPHIARVLDAGVTDTARPYFVMEYVPGEPITHFADQQRLSIRQRLELFIDVCEAIAHAHTKGVIHRDLKPSNVLTCMHEGRPRVKVIDFGIAKALDGDRLSDATYNTGIGMVLGTFEYMSPEQAAGSPDVDTRSDVYALGVLLYELLVGVRPFERNELTQRADDELRRVIREVEPPRPSTRVRSLTRMKASDDVGPSAVPPSTGNPEPVTITRFEAIAAARLIEPRMLIRLLARELEWIPLKALRKERSRRYAGPAEMAADVRNYLEGQPLSAAPESRAYRLRKFVVRHRVALAVGAMALGLLVAGVVGTSIGFLRESEARRLADHNGRRATWSAYRSAIAAADAARRNGDGIRLRWALDAAPAGLRGWEWTRLARSGVLRGSVLKSDPQVRLASSIVLHGGRRAFSSTAAADANEATEGSCLLWDISTGHIIRRENGGVISIDPTGELFAIVRPDGSIDCCEIATGKVRWQSRPPSVQRPWKLARNSFAMDGSQVVGWDGVDPALTLFDAKTGTQRRFGLSSVPTRLVGFTNLGRGGAAGDLLFYLASVMSPLRMDVQTGVSERQFGVDFVIDRDAVTGAAQSVHTLAAPDKKHPAPQRGFSFACTVLLPGRDGLAYGRDNGSIRVVVSQMIRGQVATRAYDLIIGASPVVDLAVTRDEQRFIVTLQDGSVHVVDVDEPAQVSVPFQGSRAMAATVDGSKVASAGWGDVLCVDSATGMPLWGRNLGPYDNRHLAWSRDGKLAAVAAPLPRDREGRSFSDVFILDGETGSQVAAWSASAVEVDPARPAAPPAWSEELCGLAFSADSNDLCIAHADGTVTRVDSKRWEPRNVPSATTSVTKAVFAGLVASPDGSRWAQMLDTSVGQSAGAGIVVRDSSTDAVIRQFKLEGYQPSAVAWSPDGRLIVAAFYRRGESMVVCLDGDSLVERFRFSPAGTEVVSVTFTSDSNRIVAFGRPAAMMIIDATTGEEILTATQPTEIVAAYAAPDGALLTAGGGIGLTRWDGPNADADLPTVLRRWPAECARPATIADARRLAAEAHNAVVDAYSNGEQPQLAQAFKDLDPQVQSLALAFAARRPPNINLLNSGALSMMLISAPLPAELSRGAELLRMAVAIKPQSRSLQRNLGTILFQSARFAECIEPLQISEMLSAERGAPPSPESLLRIAIAARRVGRPDAVGIYHHALSETARQSAGNDPEIRPLLEQASGEFGR